MSDKITVYVVNDSHSPLPKYATEGSSGVDLMSSEDTIIPAHEIRMIKTGLRVAVPMGWELQIRSRSGLALKNKVMVYNSPGTIDSDYRGPVNVILFNGDNTDFNVKTGDRIAQAVLCPVANIDWNLVATVDETQRNTGGFGSTGV
jgi:dUTP pyrophosphatase